MSILSMSGLNSLIGRGLRRFFPNAKAKEVKRFYSDGGEDKLRLDYDLTSESLVLDLGGYKGDWASNIYSRFCCKIIVFEPVVSFANNIEIRFYKNPNISVMKFGLGGVSRTESISICGTGSSIFINGAIKSEIQIVDVADWIQSQKISQIDLMKVNIEGGEYELIERLISTNLIRVISNIQVQFHEISNESPLRMSRIQDQLLDTHHLTYQYRFVWENWARNAKREESGGTII